MNTFHSVTLQSDMAESRTHCPAGTRIDWCPRRARMKSPNAPMATDDPRNVHTGNSASVIFINGQLNPQPSVNSPSSTHIDRGRICDDMHETRHSRDTRCSSDGTFPVDER